jgi:signal transduction histidine kinase
MPAEKGSLLVIKHVDVGDRERAAEAEALALEKGLEAEELRSRERRIVRRLAKVGQDLHTPITPVRLELHVLRTEILGPLTAHQAKALDVAARNVERWAEGEQAFARIPAQLPDKPEALDLGALVRETVEARQTEALQQGVRLLPPAHPIVLPVKVPEDAVRDALDRYLDHALKASPSGSTVAVEAQKSKGEATVAVVDSGAGLSPRELRSAFEPWNGKRPEASKDLALHYVRVQVTKAGGRTWVESDGHGQGTLLGFAFPLLKPGGFPEQK